MPVTYIIYQDELILGTELLGGSSDRYSFFPLIDCESEAFCYKVVHIVQTIETSLVFDLTFLEHTKKSNCIHNPGSSSYMFLHVLFGSTFSIL